MRFAGFGKIIATLAGYKPDRMKKYLFIALILAGCKKETTSPQPDIAHNTPFIFKVTQGYFLDSIIILTQNNLTGITQQYLKHINHPVMPNHAWDTTIILDTTLVKYKNTDVYFAAYSNFGFEIIISLQRGSDIVINRKDISYPYIRRSIKNE